MAINESADVGIFFSDFGETANIHRAADLDIDGASVLVDRDVDVVSEDRMSVSQSTLVHFRKDQLLSGADRVKLSADDQVVLLDSEGAETEECYALHRVVSEDATIVTWKVR